VTHMPTDAQPQPTDAGLTEGNPAPTGLHLRLVEPADAEAVHALLAAALPGILQDRGRWLRRYQWQYRDNPFRQNRPAGWVLLDDRQIVGHLGAVYVPLRIGEHRQLGMIAADYAVSTDTITPRRVFAGLQLAKAFFDAADDCIPLATTANDKTNAVFTRFGCMPVPWTQELWRAPTTLSQQIRSCRGGTSRILRKLFIMPGGQAFTQLATTVYLFSGRRPAVCLPAGFRLEITTPRLAPDLGSLAEPSRTPNANQPPTVTIDRTGEYLQWRYAAHPERANLRVLILRRPDNTPAAAAVVFCEDRDIRRLAFVEDIVAPPDQANMVRVFLCAALRWAADCRADCLLTTAGRRDLRPLYWELGFQCRARTAPAVVIASPLQPDETIPFDDRLELWHGAMF